MNKPKKPRLLRGSLFLRLPAPGDPFPIGKIRSSLFFLREQTLWSCVEHLRAFSCDEFSRHVSGTCRRRPERPPGVEIKNPADVLEYMYDVQPMHNVFLHNVQYLLNQI